jgi:hypothetical protein
MGVSNTPTAAGAGVVENWGVFLMRFEARELKPYAEPVASSDLQVGAIYFSVQFVDDQMLIPELDPLVFIGRDLSPGDHGTLYFQDAGSYRQGIKFESTETEDAAFYAQGESEINHIFDYERALDLLLTCSIRRNKRRGGDT